MKRIISVLLFALLLCPLMRAEYRDHRDRNVDSLEMVVAPWTMDRLKEATPEEAEWLLRAFDDLMWGYTNINGERSILFSRKTLVLAERFNYLNRIQDAYRKIGVIYWGGNQMDSAGVYLHKALEVVDRMAAGEKPYGADEPYGPVTIDDAYSNLFGTLGNYYNTLDSIDVAMDYYRKAGEIFERRGWKESSSTLYYNIGETYLDEKDYRKAEEAYEKALDYGRQSGDSLMISAALKGLASLEFERKHTGKALRYLRDADEYYSLHEDQEFRARIDILDIMGTILSRQKKTLSLLLVISCFAIFLLAVALMLVAMFRKEKTILSETQTLLEETIDDIPKQEGNNGEISLNDREIDIIRMMSEGLETAQMAEKLCLSAETVKWYRKRLRAKFDVASSAAVVAEAIKRGII